jgi:hypothetical protein
MPEQLVLPISTMPSGYETSYGLRETTVVDANVLPWLTEPRELSVSMCTMQSGEAFLLASAVGTSPKLVDAANGMTERQQRNTDNMFYSRVPEVVSRGYSPNVETMPSPATDFPIYVMRNPGGQRVYFARIALGIAEEKDTGPTIVRLAVCDKNTQGKVMSVLSGMSDRGNRRRLSK